MQIHEIPGTLSVNRHADATAFALQIFGDFLLLISKGNALLGKKTHRYANK